MTRIKTALAILVGVPAVLIVGGMFLSSPRGEGLVISFWGTDEEIANYCAMVDAFNEEHPEIVVHLEHIPRNYEMKVLAEMAGGVAPDVLVFQDEPFPEFAKRHVFEPLDAYMERDGFDTSEFFDIASESFRYEGVQYGIPKDGGVVVLFYNKRLFRRAGLECPDENWTWDDFLTAAVELTQDLDDDGMVDQVGTEVSTWWVYWLNWIWSNGGAWFNEDRTRCIVDSPEALEAITFYSDLRTKHHVAPEPGQLEGVGNAFEAGRVAMMINGPWAVIALRQIEDLEWDATFIPVGPRGRYSRYTGDAYVMSASSRHKEDAWKLIRFFAWGPGSEINASAQRAVPARRALALSSNYIRDDTPWDEQVFVDAFEHGHLQPIVTQWDEMSMIANTEIEELLIGRQSPEETLEEIERQVNELLEDAARSW